jgi:hypothetical protein
MHSVQCSYLQDRRLHEECLLPVPLLLLSLLVEGFWIPIRESTICGILPALRSPELKLEATTTVAGMFRSGLDKMTVHG